MARSQKPKIKVAPRYRPREAVTLSKLKNEARSNRLMSYQPATWPRLSLQLKDDAMPRALKHFLIAGAVAFTVAAMSGPVVAQVYLQDGPNGVGGTVVSGGSVIGQDPDIGVRASLYREDHTSGQ